MKQLKIVLAALFALAFVSDFPSWAQSFQASISGTVRDISGSVVPGAQLTATEIATGTALNTTSNDSGVYRFNGLKPGQYRLTCAVNGFKKFEQSQLTLQVNQILEINPQMQPGQATEQVTVNAAPPPLDTASATVGPSGNHSQHRESTVERSRPAGLGWAYARSNFRRQFR